MSCYKNRSRQRFVLAAIALLGSLPVTGLAAGGELESVLVTGSYSPQPELTASVSVLERDDILRLNKRNIAALLKTLPGLLVEEQGGPGGLTAVSIRGAEANFTLVLVDGVPVNDPTNSRGGGFDFANLGAALVERIEVVRGAQSAIYGSDALAGVINIITRRASSGHSQQLGVQLGEDEFGELSASALGILGPVDYALELVTRDDGEPVPGSTRKTDRLGLRLGWQLAEEQRLSASYHFLDGERSSYPEESGGPLFAATDDLDESEYRDTVLALSWEARFASRWRSTLRASRFEHEEDSDSPGIYPYSEVPPNASATEYREDRLQWVNALALGGDYNLDVGVDYRDEKGDSVGYLAFGGFELPTDFHLDRATAGAFAELSARPLPALLVQGAVRYDDPDGFDSETSLHLGANYRLGAAITLAANWGEGFKLPSFFALGHGLVGNPELLPETTRSWDLGLSWQNDAGLQLGATYFHNNFEDLITFDSATFTNINQDEVTTRGVELQANWQAGERLGLRAQSTYTDIDVKDSPVNLTGRPEWTAGLVAQWNIAPAWSTVLDWQWTGEQYAASRHTGESTVYQLDDYHRLDWVLRWQVSALAQLELSLDNLLDESYQTAVGFPGPGRSLRFGFRFGHH